MSRRAHKEKNLHFVAKGWNRLLGEVVESLFLSAFKTCLGMSTHGLLWVILR